MPSVHGDAVKNNPEICRNTKQIQRRGGQSRLNTKQHNLGSWSDVCVVWGESGLSKEEECVVQGKTRQNM